MYCIFNKQTKKLIGYCDKSTFEAAKNQYLFYEIPPEKRNLLAYKWEGDYESGSMVPLVGDTYDVSEYEEEKKLVEKLETLYPFYTQMYILGKQLYHFIELKESGLLPEFKDWFESTSKLLQHYEKRKKYFENSPHHKFITKNEQRKKFAETFE